jgi:exonuclease SbcC
VEQQYIPAEHQEQKIRVQELRDQAVRAEQTLLHVEETLTETTQQITRLEALAQAVAEHIAQRNALRRCLQFVELAREVLKEAGPYITQSYLLNISHEADRIYREIAGDHLVNLRWDNDYAVILSDREGRERSFHNLSGGEQMTAALAIRLALLREMSDIDVAFFDEPTTNLDEERRRNLAEQVRLIKGFRQLFVISHDDTFERVTDHVVRLGGNNG